MLTNHLYITVRDAIEDAADDRGRTYEAEHEAHFMAMAVIMALCAAGYEVVKKREFA